jgi:uncharacterized protein (DUF433 family)
VRRTSEERRTFFICDWQFETIILNCKNTVRILDDMWREMVMDNELLERITLDPKVMTGKPVIRGTRLTVEFILNLLAHGSTIKDIHDEYNGITPEDIQACLLFAAHTLEDTAFMPLAMETV